MAGKQSVFSSLMTLLLLAVTTGTSQAGVLDWVGGIFRSRPGWILPHRMAPTTPEKPADDPEAHVWHDSYPAAFSEAKSKRKMLLINFMPPQASREQQDLQAAIDGRPQWRAKLGQFVLCRIPADAEIQVKGEPVRVLAHAAFGEMHGRPGIAVVDLASEGQSYYGRVVSAFPFMYSKYYRWRTDHFATVLDLPPGTITQRTMIWAVRTHPERPASTAGVQDPALATAAASHSQHQAAIGVQGHHNWDGRFHRLRGLLGGGAPVEVVAESWPGQTMIDSCVDCVDSWRQSSGHWSAVRSRHSRYGYDIRRGRNGIWYGTGIFVR